MRGLDIISTLIAADFVDTGRLTLPATKPFSVDNFVRRVLVPEVAVTLISLDRQLLREDAIAELEASRSFGLAINSDVK